VAAQKEKSAASEDSLLQLEAQLRAAQRLAAVMKARSSLLDYVCLTMPDPDAPDNPTATRYEITPQARLLCEVLEKVERGELLRVCVSIGPQLGKLIAHATPVLMPSGWTTHGALAVGDDVFGSDGLPVKVVALSEDSLATMEVVFADGSVIRCHENHEWLVRDNWTLKRLPRIMSTRQMMEARLWRGERGKRGSEAHFVVDWIPVVGSEKHLPIDPYVLGAWLGDGSQDKPCITHSENDEEVALAVGQSFQLTARHIHKTTGCITSSFAGNREKKGRGQRSAMIMALHAAGVVRNKHIPGAYLAASAAQRIQLLAGLIDTDGTVHHASRRVTFANCNKNLIDDVAALIRSFGIRATITKILPVTSSSGIVGKQVCYQCSFSPPFELPCKLPRKYVRGFESVIRGRAIVDIRPCAPEPGRCIQVANEDGIYLAGRGLVATHNSQLISRAFPSWYMGRNPYKHLMLGTYSQDFANDFGGEVRELMTAPFYKQVFPGVGFRKGSLAKDVMITSKSGRMNFLGRGGAASGKPADCLAGDTMIQTENGPIPIELIVESVEKPLVYSFNHRIQRVELRPIIAARKLNAARIVEITFGDNTIKCTADHRIFVDGFGYKRAEQIRGGDRIVMLRELPKAFSKNDSGIREVGETGKDRVFLQPQMSWRQLKKEVRAMWQTNWKKDKSVLFRSLSPARQASVIGRCVSLLRRYVQAKITPDYNLFRTLCECSAFGGNGWSSKSELETWDGDEQLSGRVLQSEKNNHQARRESLCGVFWDFYDSREKWFSRSSRRLEPKKQQVRELGGSLPYVSRNTSQIKNQSVSVVRDICETNERVYDIQVEGNENFFANNALVHNCMIIDDPLKDDQEAQSSTIRKALWSWFNKVMLTRCHKFTPIVIVHTRWHEDDLIGHLVDPAHPEYDEKIAKDWTYINLPVIVKDKKLADALGLTLEVQTDPDVVEQFGDKPIATLWPERKSLKFLAAARRLDRRGFESLYEGNPSPDDGDYFKRDDLVGYQPADLPKHLMMYGASDHALTTKEENDANCAGAFGIDDSGDVWIMPDIYWERSETDETLDAILHRMKHHKILVWFAEDEHINKALGPFRRQRQREEHIHTAVLGISPGRRDLRARARSAQGMTQLRKIHFPKWTSWWPEAENELLKFPSASHDDFVSFLALIGMGLDSQTSAIVPKKTGNVYHTGTWGWLKMRSKQDAQREKMKKATAGM